MLGRKGRCVSVGSEGRRLQTECVEKGCRTTGLLPHRPLTLSHPASLASLVRQRGRAWAATSKQSERKKDAARPALYPSPASYSATSSEGAATTTGKPRRRRRRRPLTRARSFLFKASQIGLPYSSFQRILLPGLPAEH